MRKSISPPPRINTPQLIHLKNYQDNAINIF